MKWEVSGAWKADGAEGSMSVEAPNQRAAEAIAAQRGMMVEQAIPQPAAAVIVPPPIPAAPPGDTYRTLKKVAGIGFLIAAPLSVLGDDPILYLLATVSGFGWLVMAIAK